MEEFVLYSSEYSLGGHAIVMVEANTSLLEYIPVTVWYTHVWLSTIPATYIFACTPASLISYSTIRKPKLDMNMYGTLEGLIHVAGWYKYAPCLTSTEASCSQSHRH